MIPKFRAWGRNGNHPGTPSEKFEMFYDVSVVTTYQDKVQHVIADFGMYNESEYNGTEIIDYTLMQSTGLFDKNGVEVWVGDILEVRDTSCFGGIYRGAVEYLDNWGGYGFSMLDAKVISTNEFDKHSIGFLMKEFGSCFTLAEASKKSNYSYKNIGNIYENPELIERVEE